MRIQDIVNQLKAVLPRYTNYFTDQFTITSLTSSGTIATAETSAPHGLSNGSLVTIVGALVPNPITSLTSAGSIASGTTEFKHDMTQDAANGLKGYPQYLEVIGATPSEYNGSHKLLTVPNRFNFTYQLDGSLASPASGSIFLLENLVYGYNGVHLVTVTSPTTFTFNLPIELRSPASGTIIAHANYRISGAATLDRASEAYTKQPTGKYWVYVVLGDMTANKDRQADHDFTYTPGATDFYFQLVGQTVSINVFVPATNDIAAREERDLSDSLVAPFCKSLLRLRLPAEFTYASYSGLTFQGSAFGSYSNTGNFGAAVYVHQYIFENVVNLAYEDTLDPSYGSAFRDIEFSQESEFNTTVVAEGKVNLDNDA